MKHKPLDKIRVTEICRPAFYYHFRDKYDIMAWMFCHSAAETDVVSWPPPPRPCAGAPDAQLAYSIRFYCREAVGMTREWVLNDNITSAETAVRMMFASMPENMRAALFGE